MGRCKLAEGFPGEPLARKGGTIYSLMTNEASMGSDGSSAHTDSPFVGLNRMEGGDEDFAAGFAAATLLLMLSVLGTILRLRPWQTSGLMFHLPGRSRPFLRRACMLLFDEQPPDYKTRCQ